MNEEQYIGFESYINNEMPQEEKIIFEEKLQNDSQFRESFELYKETTQFLSTKFSSETLRFKENLKGISENHFAENATSKPRVISFKPWQYSIAASVVLFVGVLFFMQNGTPQYSDYNDHEKAVFVERSNAEESLKNAQDFFNAKEYGNAVASFKNIKDISSAEIQYFYAISLIETNDYLQGELFLNMIKSGNSIYKDKATWNLALSKLKQKQYEECKVYLKQIPTDTEDYDKAQELLNDLE